VSYVWISAQPIPPKTGEPWVYVVASPTRTGSSTP
jgi:hypothetical protein